LSLLLPGLDIPLDKWVQGHCQAAIGRIHSIDRIRGGNVSYVFRLHGDRGTTILKIRRSAFAEIPALRTEPALVAVEAQAIELMRASLPHDVPQVLAVSKKRGELLLEDLGEMSLGTIWAKREAAAPEVAQFGDLVGRMHRSTAHVAVGLRPDGDKRTRSHLVGYCLQQTGVSAIVAAADRCLAEPGHLVHGDLAPKNVLIRDRGLALCDFEGAHLGSRTLDVAYALAHVLVHSAPGTEPLLAAASAFLRAYAMIAGEPDGELLLPALMGVLLYRLLNEQVPYTLAMDSQVRRRTGNLITAAAAKASPSVTDVCSALAGGRNGEQCGFGGHPDRPPTSKPDSKSGLVDPALLAGGGWKCCYQPTGSDNSHQR
jgi:Ser/Thr protein kinase RdoA (MazF antagonist)